MEEKTNHDLAQEVWDYMRYEQPLEKADAIIGLGSADMRTAEWCVKLFNDGWAPKVLFTGSRGRLTRHIFNETEADVYARRALELGVPKAVIIKESQSTNTGENILFACKRLKEEGIDARKLVLVTKPYMLRRTYATFMKQWPDIEKPQVITSGVSMSMDEYVCDAYIGFDEMVNIMVGDLQRIKEYPKLGFQIKQDVPVEVAVAYEELVRRGYTKHLLYDV